MNLAVGGYWPGDPDGSTSFPQQLVVDYVHVTTSDSSGGTGGTAVQLYDCNGTNAQKWTVTAAHDIVNPAADKCLDATGNSSANGTRLQIWTCTGGANQKWTVTG